MQLLAANAQLQVQAKQNQAVQLAHADDLKTLAESSQKRNFDHICTSISAFDVTIKRRTFACKLKG